MFEGFQERRRIKRLKKMYAPIHIPVTIRYHEGAHKLERHGACYDLATTEDITLKKNEFRIIPFGINMKLPEGFILLVAPRSSTYKKWSILQTNSIGIIENDYCGNDDIIGMPVKADKAITIPAGTRIAQCWASVEPPIFDFTEVDDMECESRGGYGSTGEQVTE